MTGRAEQSARSRVRGSARSAKDKCMGLRSWDRTGNRKGPTVTGDGRVAHVEVGWTRAGVATSATNTEEGRVSS